MGVLDPLVLPSDVVIAPVAGLALELREQIDHGPGDYAVTRPRARTTSSIVDTKTAALLETFRTPATIVDAVIAFSAVEELDPRQTLDDAFAVLRDFANEGLLVPADSELAQPIATTLACGDRVGAFDVVEPVHVIVDSEVYLARAPDGSPVALKIARAGAGRGVCAMLVHEAAVMGDLDGRVNPHLLEFGALDERPYLAVSWCSGVDVYQAAAEARGLGWPEGRAALLTLAERVIEAYAHLHAQDVVHGDVHPRNVLVDAEGKVTIIDYGLAGRPCKPGTPCVDGRGGIDFFMEPEIAAARRAGRPSPALSLAGEQYSLGSLVYLLLTGTHTHAFSLEREEMLRQLLEQPPLPFEHHGAGNLSAVERTLARTLAKDPGSRYRSAAYLLRSFRAAAARDLKRARRAGGGARQPPRTRQLLDVVLARLAVPGDLFGDGLAAPTASVMSGGAGLAYALLRIAAHRQDESLLALADLWSTRAVLAVGSDEAFWNATLEIVPETVGENSFYHTVGGVHCVHALIARARADERAQQLALEAFVTATARPCEHVDVAFGRSGLLLGCALMLEALAPALDQRALRALGDGLRDSLWSQLARQPPLAQSTELRSLGAAHGWAGYLYAMLRWSEASATPPPVGVDERLEQLGALARPAGRGLRWPHAAGETATDTALSASWCNGAAGFVHLWTLAHRRFGDASFERRARLAAWSAYKGAPGPGDLCCGFAGRAYALLGLYKHSGDTTWLARARVLADHAATSIRSGSLLRDSLYKGEVGAALLAADLEQPEHACMPLYESEGWPRRATDAHRVQADDQAQPAWLGYGSATREVERPPLPNPISWR
jgi:eukaryotic-like serine/threonine-protein kinase